MNPRIVPYSLVVLVLVVASLSCRPSEKERPGDLLLITVDTMRADRLGSYGYPDAETPVLDDLARRGLLFESAFTPIPRTTPGLASLLTGLEPSRHGSREVASPITDGRLLAEVLSEQGWATATVTASGVAGPAEHLDRGFDPFVVISKAVAGEVTSRALEVASSLPLDRPKLLWVHYWDPHTPYTPPSPWAETADGELCQQLHGDYFHQRVQLGRIFGNHNGIAEKALASCSALYDGEIAYTDREIGRLLEGLEGLFDLERGLTVVTSDHGENLGEDGVYYEHGPSLHHAALRVPMILTGGGLLPSRRAEAVSLIDLAPTLLSFFGIPESAWPEMDGVDLLAPMRPRALFAESASALQVHHFERLHSGRREELHCLNGERYSLCGVGDETPEIYDHQQDPSLQHPLSAELPEITESFLDARAVWPAEEAREHAALLEGFKLVDRPLFAGGYESELFDLRTDPAETTDLSETEEGRRIQLRRALDSWLESLAEAAPIERSDEAIRRLQSLGYTGR